MKTWKKKLTTRSFKKFTKKIISQSLYNMVLQNLETRSNDIHKAYENKEFISSLMSTSLYNNPHYEQNLNNLFQEKITTQINDTLPADTDSNAHQWKAFLMGVKWGEAFERAIKALAIEYEYQNKIKQKMASRTMCTVFLIGLLILYGAVLFFTGLPASPTLTKMLVLLFTVVAILTSVFFLMTMMTMCMIQVTAKETPKDFIAFCAKKIADEVVKNTPVLNEKEIFHHTYNLQQFSSINNDPSETTSLLGGKQSPSITEQMAAFFSAMPSCRNKRGGNNQELLPSSEVSDDKKWRCTIL